MNFGCLAYISYYTVVNPMNVNSYLVTLIVIICAYVFLALTAAVSAFHLIDDYII